LPAAATALGLGYRRGSRLVDPINDDRLAPVRGKATVRGLAMTDDGVDVLAPDQAKDDNLTRILVQFCERNRYRFAILSAKSAFRTSERPPFDTTYGAFYYPWIKIYEHLLAATSSSRPPDMWPV